MSKGFTLIELVTVIAVMSIIAAVATPRFANNNLFTTRGDAGMLTASLRFAQKTAVAQRRAVYMVYQNTLPPSISLCFNVNCNLRVLDPVNGNAYTVAFSKDVTVSASTLGFDALGRPLPNVDSSFAVTNTKNNTQSFTIQVEAESGYIH